MNTKKEESLEASMIRQTILNFFLKGSFDEYKRNVFKKRSLKNYKTIIRDTTMMSTFEDNQGEMNDKEYLQYINFGDEDMVLPKRSHTVDRKKDLGALDMSKVNEWKKEMND